MTSGRFRFPTFSLITLGALMLTASACDGGSSQGCTQCPPIEGRYTLELDPGTTPASCSGVSVVLPKGPIEVSQQGSNVTATLDGLTLRGTLYSTNDFNLMGFGTSQMDGGTGQMDGGTSGPESASLTGSYVPAVGDGGVPRLEGDWQGNFSSTSSGTTRRCSVTRPFTATRQ
ncbi:hypothetical protein F0U60_30260 [Archangium minus]|uniref:Lipoprotein n=1 Tax=Archangium minus TaxID=83450 RepID=A0ABY9WXS1_9BACT|nr:hypothetical protein F0U60_30260 [Archangium minus]